MSETEYYRPITLYWQRGLRHAVASYAVDYSSDEVESMSCDKLSTLYAW